MVDSGIEPEDCKESKHCDQTETIMRVKDPLAAVWPFCGIVVEVELFISSPFSLNFFSAGWTFCHLKFCQQLLTDLFQVILLCVIIFFCEKKKTGSEKEDYDEG